MLKITCPQTLRRDPYTASMKTIRLENTRALSANLCWRGRRYKTPSYTDYEQEILYQLPDYKIPEGELRLVLTVGMKNKRADLDNKIKPLLDILQKRYGFDDNRVYEMQLRKVIVKKGGEFIEWGIEKL